MPTPARTADARPVTLEVNPRIRWAAAYSWRLLLIAALAYGALWLVGQLLLVVLPIAVALLITRALLGPATWLERRGLPPTPAATLTLLGFILVIGGLISTVGASVATEFDELGPTLSQGIDDIETWLIDDSPFDLDAQRLDELRTQAGDRLGSIASSASGSFASGAVWIVGGNLAAAVVVVTLLGAFVPIVGAIVAGIVAVLVTLVTAGLAPALIVAAIAIVVQQLDNELLAPWIYGKSLQLHPLVILLGITAGTTLFGFVGALLAVPLIAVTINVIDEARNPTIERPDEPMEPDAPAPARPA